MLASLRVGLWLAAVGLAWSPACRRCAVDAQTPAEGHASLLAGVPGTPGTADGALGTGSFDQPAAVATGGGTVYVSDKGNCAIKEVGAADGSVATLSGLAGTCAAADGAAGVARFAALGGVALDGTDLYVVDNHAVRVVDTTDGSVTTLAGVLGTPGAADGAPGTGLFDLPADVAVAVDTQLLYVADNHAIRVVDISDGHLTTLTGTLASPGAVDGAPGTALFDQPVAVALSGSFDLLFVADRANHAIRSVAVSSGDVSTYAGVLGSSGSTDGALGTNLLEHPEGLALLGNRMYISTQSHTIRELDMSTQVVSTLTGLPGTAGYVNGAPGTAELNYPRGMVASGGQLYVADTINHAVRAVVIPAVTCNEQPAQEYGEVCTTSGVLESSGLSDGSAGIAKFDGPYRLARSGTDLYVSEIFNCVIRKIDTTDGSTTTLSGQLGTCGSAVGIATQARFNYPVGLAISGTTLYVADLLNHCIREVDTTDGSSSTFSGSCQTAGADDGSASAARYNQPSGLAISSDSLYVADRLNHAVRVLSLSDGSATTLAGTLGTPGAVDSINGSPLFNYPVDLALSEAGDYVFVADRDNHAIRAINVDDGEVSTYAGILGTSGYVDGPIGTNELNLPFAVAVVGDRLYLSGDNHALRVVDMITQELFHVAGTATVAGAVDGLSGTAEFNQPYGLVPSEGGESMYVADVLNHAIRKVRIPSTCSANPTTTNFEVCTLAGVPGVTGTQDGAAGLATWSSNVRGIAWNGGWLNVADAGNHVIRYVDTKDDSGAAYTLAGEMGTSGAVDGDYLTARFNGPEGLAVSDGVIYVADTQNHAIRAVDENDGTTTTLAGVLGSSGAMDGAVGTAKFYFPVAVAVHGVKLYVSDHSNQAIRTVLIDDGSVSTLTGNLGVIGAVNGAPGTALFSHQVGIVLAGDTLFVADRDNYAIRAVDVNTGDVSTVAGVLGSQGATDGALGTNLLSKPFGLAVSGGILYIIGEGHALRAMDLSTNVVTTEAGILGSSGSGDGLQGVAQFNSPVALAVAGNNMYVADTHNYAIREVNLPAASCTAVGDVCTVAGKVGQSGYINGPVGTATLGASEHMVISGNSLYVADLGNCAIRVVDITDGSINSLSPTSDAGCGAADGDSNTALFDQPLGLAMSGTTLYVGDFGNHAIRAVSTTDGSVTTLSGTLGTSGTADGSSSVALFDGPAGLALSGTSLYVADWDNNAIRVVDTTDGSVTTLTGTPGTAGSVDGAPGTALFDHPADVALYGTILYVADNWNYAIRSVNTATGDVSTIAGELYSDDPAVDGTAAASRLIGPLALEVVGDTLYFAGEGHALRSVDVLNTGDVATFAGNLQTPGAVDANGGVALFHTLRGLAADGTHMYVLDGANYLVRKVVLPAPPPAPPSSPPPPPPSPPPGAASGQCAARHAARRCKACSCGGSIKDRMIARIRPANV